nr:hypothetical protein Itr_chr13CG20480 [Ipomoea trifida]
MESWENHGAQICFSDSVVYCSPAAPAPCYQANKVLVLMKAMQDMIYMHFLDLVSPWLENEAQGFDLAFCFPYKLLQHLWVKHQLHLAPEESSIQTSSSIALSTRMWVSKVQVELCSHLPVFFLLIFLACHAKEEPLQCLFPLSCLVSPFLAQW